MRVNGFDGQVSWGVLNDIIDGCVNSEVYARCCVHQSSAHMYGMSNRIIKSTNKLIEGYKSKSWCKWESSGQ
jgi:hypothetical protein